MRTTSSSKDFLRAVATLAACLLVACGEGDAGPEGPAGPTGATGATGATGPSGPAGGGFYTSRRDVYCVNELMGAGSQLSVTAQCANAQDLPLTGGCWSGATPPVGGAPVGWAAADPTSPAGWECAWSSNQPSAKATICCVRHP